MAKKKADAATTENGEAAAPVEKKITQRVAVTETLDSGIESPTEGVAYIKDKYGIEMTTQGFSTLKTQIRKASGGGSTKKAARASLTSKKAAPVAAATKASAHAAGVAQGVETIKGLCQQMGVDQVVHIAQLFAK